MNRSNALASFDIVHIFLDIVCVALGFAISFSLWGESSGLTNNEVKGLMSIYLVSVFIFLLVNRSLNVYNTTVFFYPDRIIRRETLAYSCGLLCAFALLINAYTINAESKLMIGLPILTYALIMVEIIFFRNIIDRFVMRKHVPRALYIGSKDSYNKFRYFLAKTSVQVNEIGYISLEDDDDSIEYIGRLKDLESLIRKYNIDQVFFLQKRELDIKYLQEYIDICIEMGVTCRVVIDTFRRRKAFSFVSSIGTYPVMTFHTVTMNKYEDVLKRFFDIVVSLFAIVITSPIMIVTAIAIKLDSPGPVIFKQVRVGKNGRHFRMWKFRSMQQNAEEMKAELEQFNEVQDGMMFKMKDDPRVTKVGKFLRKTSIDELPQFFNVLSGSMSLVGTRPPTLDEVEKYSMKEWRRISIKPGITGMWQVSGRSNITDFDKVVELDTYYIDEWSIWLDLKIMFLTLGKVFKREGSY